MHASSGLRLRRRHRVPPVPPERRRGDDAAGERLSTKANYRKRNVREQKGEGAYYFFGPPAGLDMMIWSTRSTVTAASTANLNADSLTA